MRYLLTIILIPCLISCSTSAFHPLAQGDRLEENSQSIKVILMNQNVITFESGEYTVNETSDSAYIKGIWTQVSGTDHEGSRFEGSIGFREIKEIQVLESSESAQIVIGLVVGVTLGGMFLLAISQRSDL